MRELNLRRAQWIKRSPPRKTWSRAVRHRVHQRDEFRCKACRALGIPTPRNGGGFRYPIEGLPEEHLSLDHRVALANGGTDTEDNLQTLCTPCNRAKGAKRV